MPFSRCQIIITQIYEGPMFMLEGGGGGRKNQNIEREL